MSQRLPSFLVVGAAKSGTSSIHHYLNAHPEIYMPKEKELYFWQIAGNPNLSIVDMLGQDNVKTTLSDYLECFVGADEKQIIGESCPSYLYFHDQVLENLKLHHPGWKQLKIIIVLRHPVDRIISQYKFVCKNRLDPDNLSFVESLEKEGIRKYQNLVLPDLFYKSVSTYSEQVRAYRNNFSNVHIGLFDDLQNNPAKFMREIFNFLELEGEPPISPDYSIFNSSAEARRANSVGLSTAIRKAIGPFYDRLPVSMRAFFKHHGEKLLTRPITIPDDSLAKLHREFLEEIEILEKVINKDLSGWKLKSMQFRVSHRAP